MGAGGAEPGDAGVRRAVDRTLDAGPRAAALATLTGIGAGYTAHASELALSYAAHAARHGHPHQSLVGVGPAGARLGGFTIECDGPILSLAGADLREAVLDRVDLTGADLSGADLTKAEFHRSRLTSARLDGATATGTILRDCTIDGLDLGAATAYEAQALRCRPEAAEQPGWRAAPAPSHPAAPGPTRLQVLTGHSGGVLAVADSPDGTHLTTAGNDGTVRIWEGRSGARVTTIHLSPGRGVAVFDALTGTLTGATPGASRWLGWTVVENGRMVRLPAETFGELPPLLPAPPPPR